MLPWNGIYVPVILKELRYPEIRDCGDFSLIETISDVLAGKRKWTPEQIVNYSELQYKIVKASLVNPTLDEIMSLNEYDAIAVNAKKEIKELQELIDTLPDGPKYEKLQNELNTLRMEYEFILPSDFIGTVMSYALETNKTDIKLVSEDMLFEAAVRAKSSNGSIADHLPGLFSDFNKQDIINRGLVIYHERTQKDR